MPSKVTDPGGLDGSLAGTGGATMSGFTASSSPMRPAAPAAATISLQTSLSCPSELAPSTA